MSYYDPTLLTHCPCGCGQYEEDDEFMERHRLFLINCGSLDLLLPGSGYRCAGFNKALGGMANSAYSRGTAFEQPYRDEREQFLIIKAAYAAGFTQISVFLGLQHVYIGCDHTMTEPRFGVYP